MSTGPVPAGRLDRFLADRDISRESLGAAIGEPFGPPLLVVATGSVLQGVGNIRSDLDINVIVERQVTRFPLAAYVGGTLLDTTYFSASEVEEWTGDLRDRPWPPPGHLDRRQWGKQRAKLVNAARFAYGAVLAARDGWDERIAAFRQPWLRSRIARWWRVEALRRWLAARWLAEARPLLASQRQLDAVLAALESRVATAGEFYFGSKWLPEKLRVLDDRDGLAALRSVMTMPTVAAEVPAYLARCDDLLERLGGIRERDVAAQLTLLPGVALHRLHDETLVSRWNARGVVLGEDPSLPEPPAPVWEGDPETPLPPGIHALFVEDMTWLSIVAAPK